jgi:hypothetical protein
MALRCLGTVPAFSASSATHPLVTQMIHRPAPGHITGSQLVELQAEVT